ncbi:putative sensor protein [Leptolyngbya sp. NIES-3755]|nr:putative sensor protein [Leptolyngbya sp. NIES-3755]
MQRTTYLTFAIGIAALLVSILIGLIATRWIVRPLLQLHAAAIALKNDAFDVDSIAHLIRRPDELGQLAKVFEEMAQVILSREQSLSDQIHQLREESADAKRTALSNQSGINFQALLLRSQQVRQGVESDRNN